MSLDDIKEAIKNLTDQEKQELLQELPQLLQIPVDKLAWMKLAESSFEFWDNEEDKIYDQL
ncbi:MAG: hypothetical protein Q9P14_14885 [candidate division KSB1 bacterium]|nr:hypothetical protein [candidate division KSB1 bacterium]MDQ7064193.1 hypothetical protein [candidate division KSB1 bacterium]